MKTHARSVSLRFAVAATVLLLFSVATATADATGMTLEQLSALREIGSVAVSPGGGRIAYTLEIPRTIGEDEDGPEWVELWLVDSDGSNARPYVHGEVRVSDVRFSPDGRFVTYLAKRGKDEHRGLWAIPVDGGESKRLVDFDSDVLGYRLAPDGERVAFVALEPKSETEKEAEEKGYKQEVFEEDWRERHVWLSRIAPWAATVPDPTATGADDGDEADDDPRALPVEGAVFDAIWTPDGQALVLSVAPTPLIDDRYMRRRIRVYDVENGALQAAVSNPGKLGPFSVSPDGRTIAMITAADPNDPLEGRLSVVPIDGGEPRDLMPGLEGHVFAMAWRGADALLFLADVGEETLLAEIPLEGGAPRELLRSGAGTGDARVPVMTDLSLSRDGTVAALVGERPTHPGEVWATNVAGAAPRRLTDSNPWLAGVELARQEVYGWTARDGLELRGVLIRPLEGDGRSPLMLIVHGGPEGHVRNGWVTSYSRPGQVAAAEGYSVLYPNYRGSTGRGVAFSKLGQGDAAGAEFDDLIDAIDALVRDGSVDTDRVGVTGGSYGGYATAWCATRYTERFRAGVMFVGISNKVSKGLTTEIPYEDRMVHTLFDPWTRWQFSLERSPVYYAEQSRTALLIAGGTADTRVHPSQSLQLYRALRLIGNAPVRYVRYPGEGHGNLRAAARDDYARRLMRWMNHFVRTDATEPPPWELPLPEDDEEAAD